MYTSTFWLSTKCHSTNVRSCHTSSFGHEDSATSVLIYERTRRGTSGVLHLPKVPTSRNILYSGGQRGPRIGLADTVIGDGHNFSHRPPNSTQSSQQPCTRTLLTFGNLISAMVPKGKITRDHLLGSTIIYMCSWCNHCDRELKLSSNYVNAVIHRHQF